MNNSAHWDDDTRDAFLSCKLLTQSFEDDASTDGICRLSAEYTDTIGFLCQQFRSDQSISVTLRMEDGIEAVSTERQLYRAITTYGVVQVVFAIERIMDEIEFLDAARRRNAWMHY